MPVGMLFVSAARGLANLTAARRNYVLLNRPQGCPCPRAAREVAWKVNLARYFLGLQAAQKVSIAMCRAAGYPGLETSRKIALEVYRAKGFSNLKAVLEI